MGSNFFSAFTPVLQIMSFILVKISSKGYRHRRGRPRARCYCILKRYSAFCEFIEKWGSIHAIVYKTAAIGTQAIYSN